MLTENPLLHEIDNFSEFWRNICHQYPPGLIESTVSSIVLTVGFVLPATIYLLLDQFPRFAVKRKIQPWEKQPTAKETRRCIAHSLFAYSYTCAGIFAFHWLLDWRLSTYRLDPELPTLPCLIADFIYAIVFREVIFYYIHRLLHHQYFYWIHKKHHEFNTPISFATIYCHPIEMFLQNVLPTSLPLAVSRGHFLSQMLFATYALWDSTALHSGYKFGRLPTPEVHDLHHEKSQVNYGVIGFMDWLHGTDRSPIVEASHSE